MEDKTSLRKDRLKKHAYVNIGMTATLVCLYLLNKFNLITPKTEGYWTVLMIVALICFAIGCILLYKANKIKNIGG